MSSTNLKKFGIGSQRTESRTRALYSTDTARKKLEILFSHEHLGRLERSADVQQPEAALAVKDSSCSTGEQYEASRRDHRGNQREPESHSFRQGSVVNSWKTNDPSGGEIRVSTSLYDEKLVSKSKKQCGQEEIAWIADSTIFDFRLYGNSQPEARLDSVLVRRAIDSAPIALQDLADEVRRGNIDLAELSRFVAAVVPDCFRSPHFRQFFGVTLRELAVMRNNIDVNELSQFIATVVTRCLFNREFHESFLLWERNGFHVTPVHFYQPIPILSAYRKDSGSGRASSWELI